jgi:pimeloyl-ACP methyl ester carboxylesterase
MSLPRMLRVQGAGVTIQVAEWPGQDPPVLAVHGLTANCRSFDRLAQALAPARRVLAVDLRGRGLSGKPATGYSIPHHRADLLAVLDHLGVKKASVMGHSLGAYISLAVAADAPERVERLILLDGGAVLSLEQWAKVGAGIQPTLERLGKDFPSFEAYLEVVQRAPYIKPWNDHLTEYYRYESEEIQGRFRSRVLPAAIAEERANIRSFDPAKAYPRIACPVLILRATQGMIVPDDLLLLEPAVRALTQALAQARVVDLPGINHFSIAFGPSPERDQALRDFLIG